MKLYIFKQDALDYFKINISSNIDNYQSSNNQWVYEQFSNPFIELKMDIDDFDLYIDVNNPNKMDLENSKIIYSNLRNLSDSMAMDERLWAGLTHSVFYEYVQKRWSKSKNMNKKNIILTRYFFGIHTPKFRNTLCKLWWIGRLTYDETNQQNPFHLTDVLGNYDMSTRVNDLFTSNFSRNINVVKAFLETVGEYESSGKRINEDIFRSAVQYLNILGGVCLLDYYSIDELKEKIKSQIEKYFVEGPDVSKQQRKKLAQTIYLNDIVTLMDCETKREYKISITQKYINAFLERKINDIVEYRGKQFKVVNIKKNKQY